MTGGLARDRERLRSNLAEVSDRIERALSRAGRRSGSVTLVAVTKTVSADTTRLLVDLGVRDLGENRVQAGAAKIDRLADLRTSVRWHMIGHLQRNKVRASLGTFDVYHAIDSLRLLQAFAAARRSEEASSLPIEGFVQVNVSGESSKQGVPADRLAPTLGELLAASREAGIRLVGLMTMAPLSEHSEESRVHFRRLRDLLEDVRMRYPEAEMNALSMGMSQDYEIAVEEGATHVRVGSALFEGLDALRRPNHDPENA